MYGYSLIMPVQDRVLTEASQIHISHGWRYCMEHLEDESSFIVSAFLLITGYYAERKQVQKMTQATALAVSCAKYLGLYRGEHAVFLTPTGHEFDVTHLNKVLWIALHLADVDIGISTNISFLIEAFGVEESLLNSYDESLTGDHAIENYLSYPKVQIPLMGYYKRVHILLQNTKINKIEWLEVTRKMEFWYDNLDPKFKCTTHDTIWKGFIISYINLRYINLQLKMVRKDLLARLSTSQHHLIHTPLLQHCLRYLAIVSKICELFLQNDNSNLDLMGIGAPMCDAIATCALFHLAIGSSCSEHKSTVRRVIPLFKSAVKVLQEGYSPQLLHQLHQAMQKPELAYGMLSRL
ncbi:hypothetical protein HDU91_001150 [Kappamyces sp. JEL0680]|nr:hypothetical protein HDU91_001150 [Kappamyces sp. JEL0680]